MKRGTFTAIAACVAAAASLALPAGAAAAAATHFQIATNPTTVTPGVPFDLTVSARDNSEAIDTSYAGTVAFSSNDPTATLPSSSTLTMGTKTFTGVVLNTPGCRRITADDGTLATSSAPIPVTGCDIVDTANAATISGGDPTQTGILDSSGAASNCSTPSVSSLDSATGSRAYDSYTHTNLTNGPICFTVDVTPGATDCNDAQIGLASYLGSFAPANPLTNYLADPGTTSGEIGEAMSESFTLAAGATFADVVYVTFPSETCSSYSYLLSANKPFAQSLPAAVGTAAVGNVLGWETGTWNGSPTFSYQWRRCDSGGAGCADIPGATSGTYEVTNADAGSTLRIRVGATDALGTSTADSPPTAVVPAVAVQPTGKRAAALKKCAKIKNKAKKKRCKARARKLPV